MTEPDQRVVRGLRKAASIANMTPRTLRRMIAEGIGPRHLRTSGGEFRFSRRALAEWVDGRTTAEERSA